VSLIARSRRLDKHDKAADINRLDRRPRRDWRRLGNSGTLETMRLPPGLRTLMPWAAANRLGALIRQSRQFARISSSVLSARGMPGPLLSVAMVSAAVPRKQAQRVASPFRKGRVTTSAEAVASAFRLIAAAILAPTASLAARSGSTDRCA
jgi:hypothetical protein